MSTRPGPIIPVLPNQLGSPNPLHETPVSAREAGCLLRMHPKTVLRKARAGILPAHPLGGNRKRWRFYLSALDQWLRSQKLQPAPIAS